MLKFLSRILLAIPVWLAYLIPMTLLVLLGFIIVPLAAALDYLANRYNIIPYTWTMRASRASLYKGRAVMAWRPRWLWIFGNEEDGIDGTANGFQRRAGTTFSWAVAWQIFAWSAWRNSVGNARWLPFFGLTISDPKDIVVYVPPSGLDAMHLTAGFTPFADRWNEYRKLGPYIARYGWQFELKFPWYSSSLCRNAGCFTCAPHRRYFWIGWRIAQQDAPNTGIGFAFQPWSKL